MLNHPALSSTLHNPSILYHFSSPTIHHPRLSTIRRLLRRFFSTSTYHLSQPTTHQFQTAFPQPPCLLIQDLRLPIPDHLTSILASQFWTLWFPIPQRSTFQLRNRSNFLTSLLRLPFTILAPSATGFQFNAYKPLCVARIILKEFGSGEGNHGVGITHTVVDE
jgi:hypothetical protein